MLRKIEQTILIGFVNSRNQKLNMVVKQKLTACSFFGYQIDILMGQVMIFLMDEKKIEKSYFRFREKPMLKI